MQFEVYCDESMVDLFTSAAPQARYMLIGSLWLPAHLRTDVKDSINKIRAKHNVWGEIKWVKLSPANLQFYIDLVDMFFAYGRKVRFRCIAVDADAYNAAFHGGDNELGFYKFYYQMLKHWILDNNEYRIFCDLKSTRDKNRMHKLHHYLLQSNRLANITGVQAIPSSQSVLTQLCDVLLGLACRRLNGSEHVGAAKNALLAHMETQLGRSLCPTARGEDKYNIFKIHLRGGW